MKFLIFDAGPIISLTMNGMLHILDELKKDFDGEFILPRRVKGEVVDRPMKIKKYKLEALQVQDMIDRGIFKMADKIIPQQKIDSEVKKILKLVNGFLRTSKDGKKMNIIHEGEAACLAVSRLCGAENLIAIDERTTRMIIESPQSLENMMEKKLHMPLDSNMDLLKDLGDFRFIRSSELLFVAYKKGLFKIKKSKELLDALLYGVKFKGTAISSSEIEKMKKMI
jgi:hypothetical protein